MMAVAEPCRVVWPGGISQTIYDPALKARLRADESGRSGTARCGCNGAGKGLMAELGNQPAIRTLSGRYDPV
jgi:hypothetical protein